MLLEQDIIEQTKKWIIDVVIGCNFCPFAATVVKEKSVSFKVERSEDIEICLQTFFDEVERMDEDINIDTAFIIFPNSFEQFDDYLDLVSLAEKLLLKNDYEGIYQLASFHPLYQFANSDENDAANYTNRSVYPMLHLLREDSIDKVLEHYKNPDNIPERNIDYTRAKGLEYMKTLREACLK